MEIKTAVGLLVKELVLQGCRRCRFNIMTFSVAYYALTPRFSLDIRSYSKPQPPISHIATPPPPPPCWQGTNPMNETKRMLDDTHKNDKTFRPVAIWSNKQLILISPRHEWPLYITGVKYVIRCSRQTDRQRRLYTSSCFIEGTQEYKYAISLCGVCTASSSVHNDQKTEYFLSSSLWTTLSIRYCYSSLRQ